MSRTMLDKIWDSHVVRSRAGEPDILYVDLHLLHEVTSPQAFAELETRKLAVRMPERCFATIDHSTPTLPFSATDGPAYATSDAKAQVQALLDNCRRHGIRCADWGSEDRGIVHVIGPELGLTRPGMTIVCGDSHTSTHGAFGALAFGIGSTEVGHVLATQCLFQTRPQSMRIALEGPRRRGTSAKDIALKAIATLGARGGTGHVAEFAGSGVRALSMEERMTLCNMSIEFGARAGMIAPDDVTFHWMSGRTYAPKGKAWEQALRDWRTLPSDSDARFDKEVHIDLTCLSPMVTFGTSPDASIGIHESVPFPTSSAGRDALAYMRFEPGRPIAGTPVDRVFVGSCTNSRLSDLRAVARLLAHRPVHPAVKMIIVPGSQQVRRAAEEEGLHETFLKAGAEWRLPGCSMCIAMNGDQGAPGELVVSTSNRNFVGRQGKDVRTVLASPETAAASAIAGEIADPNAFVDQSYVV